MNEYLLVNEVETLIRLLSTGAPLPFGAIPWASPVVSFGNPLKCSIATLGLNPSNLEFVDKNGKELQIPFNRFESLATLQAISWLEVKVEDMEKVWQACAEYFYRNPYNQWFRRLEKILVYTGASYYARLGETACHLDLVQFATENKWSSLTVSQRSRLIEFGAPSLARTIKSSNIQVLVLNGSTVVKEFNRLLPAAESLVPEFQPSWCLQEGRVQGVSYVGHVSQLGNTPLGREVLVLGFNHNIQSSFGVTGEATSRIGSWVGEKTKGVLHETR